MSQPAHQDIRRLIEELILPFYLVKRDMRMPIGRRRLENDAEHSWSLALLACALAPQIDPKLDIGKVAQFAIVHDLVEIYADDTTPWGNKAHMSTKDDREHQALERIAKDFATFPWIAGTIREYEKHDSPESIFIWSTDKYLARLVRTMDGGQFFRSIKLTREQFDERLASTHKKAHAHPAIGRLYDDAAADITDDHFHPPKAK